mmetsp:Transcript_29824/g.86569  ORF Transcript_29824/g.86569 Transcript_29824/m.86569 type:complete len:208 (-) Transcript_29824:721-1344(-)
MSLTSSKGPPTFDATCSAKRRKASDFKRFASWRRRFTAFALGSACCKKAVAPSASAGFGGSTGLDGASVRTPETFPRIMMPASMASTSRWRSLDRSSHSDFFMVQSVLVASKAFSSASKSALAFFKEPSAAARSDWTSPRVVVFSPFELSAAAKAASRAFFAKSYAFCAAVSRFVPSTRWSSNFLLSSFISSTTLSDLNSYFCTWSP